MGYGKRGIEIKDALALRVHWAPDLEVKEDDGVILSITLPEYPTIEIGNTVTVDKCPYRINQILPSSSPNQKAYDLIMAQRTKSSLFLLPMMPGNKTSYFTEKLMLNCFMATPEHDMCVALLYRFSGVKEFTVFERQLLALDNFIECKDTSKFSALYIFTIPEEFMEDYVHFRNGRYSQFSDRYKERVMRFHGVGAQSALGQILYKSPERKKELEKRLEVIIPDNAEVHSVPDLIKETFNAELYRI
jgi:hypothetical protein